jgi:putative cell wall-binding protein
MNGTMFAPPLETIRKIYHEINRKNVVKMLVILSDFGFADSNSAWNVMEQMVREENVIPILLANGGNNHIANTDAAINTANVWCDHKFPVAGLYKVNDLPTAFMAAYKHFALMPTQDIISGAWKKKPVSIDFGGKK